jgi:branched-chain amino acid transport system permease protein
MPLNKRTVFCSTGALAVLLLLPAFLNDHLLSIAITGMMWAYLCLCWNLTFGYAGLFSLGHMLFWGIGGYTSTFLFVNFSISPWIGMFAGAVLAGLSAYLISKLVLRYKIINIYFALITLAFAEVVMGLIYNCDYLGGSVGILLPLKNSPGDMLFTERYPYYYIILGFLIVGILATYVISRKKIGYYLIAIREDTLAAEIAGVPTEKYKTIIFVISAFMIAFAGTFYAQFFLYIDPGIMFGFGPQLNMLIGTMVGGAGTILGPVLGSTVFTFLGEILRGLPFEHGREIVTIERIVWSFVLILVIFYLPGGLISTFTKYRKKSN